MCGHGQMHSWFADFVQVVLLFLSEIRFRLEQAKRIYMCVCKFVLFMNATYISRPCMHIDMAQFVDPSHGSTWVEDWDVEGILAAALI